MFTIDANHDEVIRKTKIMRTWLDLPLELVDLIASRLKFPDRIRFRTVCKSWYSSLAPIRVPEPGERPWPMLVYLSDDREGKLKFFDPIIGKTEEHCFDIPTYGLLTLRSAKNGWMVMTDEFVDEDEDGDILIFTANVFSLKEGIFGLPFVAYICPFQGVCSSSPPTNSDCVIIGISCNAKNYSNTSIYIWRHGQDFWSKKRYKNHIPFILGDSNPVYHHGFFYCLGRNGNLGVFDPIVEIWIVLDKPKPISRRERDGCCYLVKSFKGHLLSIFDHDNGRPLLVMRLDESKMAWTELEDLEDEVLFLDARDSISIPAPSKRFENRIYFARFVSDGSERDEAVYYSLKSRKYHSNPNYKVQEKGLRAWVMRGVD